MSIHPDVSLTDWNAQTRAVVLEVDQLFPGLEWGTYPGHDPNEARAGDGMVPGYNTAAGIAKGTAVAEWLWANRVRYNIWYVIWRGRIISQTRPEKGWITYYPPKAAIDRSPDSAYHRNHPHFSTYPLKATPYGTVFLDRLRPGVEDSESVRIVQRALGIAASGAYDAATISAARVFQRVTLGDPPEYADGVLGKWQTTELLKRGKAWATLRLDPSGDPAPAVIPEAPVGVPEEPAPPVVLPPLTPAVTPGSAISEAARAVARKTLANVDLAAAAADRTGCPWWLLCAVLEKETGGRNIYGHDKGGALTDPDGKDVEVTPDNWATFRDLVLVKGKTSNGVGPMQLTWKPFFTDMESRGLKPWDPADNLLYGAELLAKYWKSAKGTTDQRVKAVGGLYNTAAYGDRLVTVAAAWRSKLAKAGEAALYPVPDSGEVYLDRLQPGVTGSDSVAYVQIWLAKVLGQEVTRSGAYDDATQGAARAYQRDVLGDAPEYADGVLGPEQTVRLLVAAGAESVKVYRSSKDGGQIWPQVVVTPPDPKPAAKPARATLRLKAWNGSPAGRTLIQGAYWDDVNDCWWIWQADDVAGQKEQTIVIRRHKADGTYVGYATLPGAGHGSSLGFEPFQGGVRIWIGHATKGAGYLTYRIGVAETPWTKAPIPNGDTTVNVATDTVCVRVGTSYRGYSLSAAKAGKATKLWGCSVPNWLKRFQGHVLVGKGASERLAIHRDDKTKGASELRTYSLKGVKLTAHNTDPLGDESEGAVGKDGWLHAVERTGGDSPSRVLTVTPVERI